MTEIIVMGNSNLLPEFCPQLHLDSPYGAGQQDWYQYEVSVLVLHYLHSLSTCTLVSTDLSGRSIRG